MAEISDERAMLAYLEDVFPQVTGKIEILRLETDITSVKLKTNEADLRPGGTVSGPSMFLLSDVAFYVAVLSAIGREPLAVTTSCTINFLRKPDPNDLIANARIFKRGRKLIVGEVILSSAYSAEPVAHATFTYSIPSRSEGG